MKLARSWLIWLALAVCAATVFGAMTWLTRGVLAAERQRLVAEHERVAAERRADLEERTRLALWRMDALGAAILLRENRHPPEQFRQELRLQLPDPEVPAGELVAGTEPEVILHFDIQADRGLTSPEVAKAANGKAGVAVARGQAARAPGAAAVAVAGGEMARSAVERLQRLRALLASHPLAGDEWAQLNRAAEVGESAWNGVPKQATQQVMDNGLLRQSKSADQVRQDANYQMNSSANEHVQRARAVLGQQGAASQVDVPAAGFGEVAAVGQMRGVWLGDELLLLRQVILNHPAAPAMQSGSPRETLVQGAWLDARKVREQLLGEIADLLPHAQLLATDAGRAAVNPLALVSFPFRLERNEAVVNSGAPATVALGAALWVGWTAVGVAVLTTSLLLRGVMRLSERRASFVSAVTHELRTPLTTFRLYADMLESGAVKPEKRGEYLRVLAREADRLSHLVENVLAFSRIERGSARALRRELSLAEMLEPLRERLESRLASAGMRLQMDLSGSAAALRVHVDAAAVEHVLFNLVDNAAKYASGGTPPQVTLQVAAAGRHVYLRVSDHGPGIPPAERQRIFQAFHKSARDAAESRPGVGLGLALSRRLARNLGGELTYAPGPGSNGAGFVLALPVLE